MTAWTDLVKKIMKRDKLSLKDAMKKAKAEYKKPATATKKAPAKKKKMSVQGRYDISLGERKGATSTKRVSQKGRRDIGEAQIVKGRLGKLPSDKKK